MTYVCKDSYLSTSPYKNQAEGDTSRFSNIDDITLNSSSCPKYDVYKIEIRYLNGNKRNGHYNVSMAAQINSLSVVSKIYPFQMLTF